MSMTLEEANVLLKMMFAFWANTHEQTNVEMEMALNLALAALRPVSREQVEKVWKSEWIDNGERDPNGVPKTFAISCKRCGSSAGTSWMRFCPACGAPMTDKAVQMVMERMNKLEGMKNELD